MRAMAADRAVAAAESTATLERHVSMARSGTGNKNVGTRDGLVGGGAVASSESTGRSKVPKTLLWSRKMVERVIVSPIWSAICRGSHAHGEMVDARSHPGHVRRRESGCFSPCPPRKSEGIDVSIFWSGSCSTTLKVPY